MNSCTQSLSEFRRERSICELLRGILLDVVGEELSTIWPAEVHDDVLSNNKFSNCRQHRRKLHSRLVWGNWRNNLWLKAFCLLYLVIYFDRVSLCSLCWPGTDYVAWSDLELLPLPPVCWNQIHAPPYMAWKLPFVTQACVCFIVIMLVQLQEHCYTWNQR